MKKGFSLSIEYVALLILIIIGIIAGFAWIAKIGQNFDEEIINQHCFQSVAMNADRRVPGVEAQTVKVKCPTKYVTFHMAAAEAEYESNPSDRENEAVVLPEEEYKDTDLEKCEDGDDEEACRFRNINRITASEIARCWRNFHQGQKRVFSVYNEERQCVVCSVMFFDDDMISEYGDMGLIGMIDPENPDYSLETYMKTKSVLKYTGNTNVYEYTLDFIDKNYQLPPYDYDVNNEYAVVFVAYNENAIKSLGDQIWEKFKEWLTKEKAPDEDEGNFVNTLEFIPNDEVPNRCDTWA